MRFRFSQNTALCSTNAEQALGFYRDTLGLNVQNTEWGPVVQQGHFEMFMEETQQYSGLLLELVTEDLGQARTYLEANGCKILQWEGLGKACIVEDPFGLRFNVWQEPQISNNNYKDKK